ncbi:MAG TPA: DUF1501 domain-containing protein [Gemmataceae bacterium]|nr:DUF1501 domain-containing protein [Gemmataceae bacterium]
MLHLCGPSPRLCDGIRRREFLRAGGLALAGISLPHLLSAQAATGKARCKSVIQLYLWGGPAQQETFDLKPHAPSGIRGDFRPTAARTPGLLICEHLPRLAELSEQYAIIRSLTHTGVNHGTSAYHMLTGRIHATPGTLRHPAPTDHPSVNAAVNRFIRPAHGLPATVSLPSVLYDGDGGEVPGQGPGLLGQRYTPFMVNGDPTRPDFSIETLTLPGDVDGPRFRRRIALQAAFDREGERLAHRPAARAMDDYHEQAFRLLQSPAARRAFRLSAEPARVRERYGRHHFGQSCLLARRLVEAGVRLVTVYWNAPTNTDNQSWDTHSNSFERLKKYLLPAYDRAVTALLEDLQARGLLAETLVLSMGEFGRTPKINKQAGRDHWGFCQSMLLFGGGVRGGQVYGSSDASAAYAAELPVSPDDVAATVFHGLGIALDQEIRDSQGRPLPLCRGKPVLGLF